MFVAVPIHKHPILRLSPPLSIAFLHNFDSRPQSCRHLNVQWKLFRKEYLFLLTHFGSLSEEQTPHQSVGTVCAGASVISRRSRLCVGTRRPPRVERPVHTHAELALRRRGHRPPLTPPDNLLLHPQLGTSRLFPLQMVAVRAPPICRLTDPAFSGGNQLMWSICSSSRFRPDRC